MPRTIAIGDIHGCAIALAKLIEIIAPQPDDIVVPLGDYVDRGIDSRGVIDQLIALADRCRLVPILGNHEEMLLGAREGRSDFRFWMNCGGITCLDSYGSTGRMDLIPREHVAFLQSCRTYFETERHFFVHANYEPDILLDRQTLYTRRRLSLRDYVPPAPHCSGKVAIIGMPGGWWVGPNWQRRPMAQSSPSGTLASGSSPSVTLGAQRPASAHRMASLGSSLP